MQRHDADAVAGFLRTHAVLSAGVAVTVLFVTKVWLSAGGEPSVAAGIVAASGSLELATSLLVLALPVVVFSLAAFLIVLALPGRSRRAGPAPAIGAAVAVFLALAIAPLGLLLAVLVGAGAAVLAARLRRARSGSGATSPPSFRDLTLAAGLLGALWIVQPSLMWLPAERLTVAGAERVDVGYVLEDEGPWLTVLRHGDRRLLRIEVGSVSDREICSFVDASAVLGRSLANLLVAPGSSTPCTAEP